MEQDPGSGPLEQVTLLRAGDRSDAIYDEWADQYEDDLLGAFGYTAHLLAVNALLPLLDDRATPIVDFGCGTGLVGEALHAAGVETVDGVDHSPGMLAEARRKGAYRTLIEADLTRPNPLATAAYGAMICVGVMGAGHLTPDHFADLFRTVAPGGPIVLFGNGTPFAEDGYAERFAALEWTIERTETPNYMAGLNRPGALVIGRR